MFKSFLKIIIVAFIFGLGSTSCTIQNRHVPQYVENIPQRAQYIASQSHYLSPKLVVMALNAYNKAQSLGYGEKHILTIIDYSEPSTCSRFWVIDLNTNKILFQELVAHGQGSGSLYATNFSDQINSKSTSVGVYLTAPSPYYGRHGYSLRLKGLEPGFNGNAWTRAIVLHSAPYVCQSFAHTHGFVGRSWGCPALNPKDIKQIINVLKGNTLIFAYGNNPDWLKHSHFLNHN